MATLKEITEGMPEKFNGLFKKVILIIFGIIIIKIFGLDYFGMETRSTNGEIIFPPYYIQWLTISKILVVAMAFMLMKYGWKKPDRGTSKIVEEIMVFYEGTARIAGTVIAIAALAKPLKILIGYLIPNIFKLIDNFGYTIKIQANTIYLVVLLIWYIVWLTFLYRAIKKDKYNQVMGDIITSEGVQNMILGLIRFVVMLPVKVLRMRRR